MKTRVWLTMVLVTMCGADAFGSEVSERRRAHLAENPVRFAILGDRTGGHVEGIFGQIVNEAHRLKPEFVMTVGDMIEGYTEDTTVLNAEWQESLSLLEPLDVPVYHTPGNHDITTDPLEEQYRRYIGEPVYSFEHRGVHIIVLDNSRVDVEDELPPEQMEWLAGDLAANRDAAYTLVFLHKPYWYNTIAVGKPHALHSLLVEHDVDAVITGHFHLYFSGEYDGIVYTSIGSSGGGMTDRLSGLGYHFAWATIDNEGIVIVPVALNGVRPWDEFTAAEYHVIEDVNDQGLVTGAVSIPSQVSPVEAKVAVVVQNISRELTVEDTLRWEVPDGWSVDEAATPVHVPPGQTVQLQYRVTNTGPLYPAPRARLSFPYAEGKAYTVAKAINIKRRVLCRPAAEPPTIDGVPSDAVWREPVSRLYPPDVDMAIIDSTAFFFARDDDYLYLAAYCHESEADAIHAATMEHDGAVYGEDCVGYFFSPDTAANTVYQLYFNPHGVAFDQKIVWSGEGYEYDADPEWNGKYDVATTRGEDHWSIEVAIPLSELGIAEEGSSEWLVNFRRKQKRLNSSGDWQVPIEYDPKTYGVMVMKE